MNTHKTVHSTCVFMYAYMLLHMILFTLCVFMYDICIYVYIYIYIHIYICICIYTYIGISISVNTYFLLYLLLHGPYILPKENYIESKENSIESKENYIESKESYIPFQKALWTINEHPTYIYKYLWNIYNLLKFAQWRSPFCRRTLGSITLYPQTRTQEEPIADTVAQNLVIISEKFQFSTWLTRILMGFITSTIYDVVLIANPIGRIVVRLKSCGNNLGIVCHRIALYHARRTSDFKYLDLQI